MKTVKYSLAVLACLTLTSLAPVNEVQIKEFSAGGMKVIYKPSAKEIVSIRLFIKGGTANYTKEQEGIENLALAVATEGGTKKLSMTDFGSAADKVGAQISFSSSYDYSQISLSCLSTYWNESWTLFADAITQPRFDSQAFDIIKGKVVSGAKEQEGNPDQYLANKSMELSYAGRNYSKIPGGTAPSLEKINLDQVKNHFNNVINKANCFIVVVGNVTEADLTAKINSAFAQLPQGQSAKSEPKTDIQAGVTIENREIATNYIRGNMSGPALNEPDAVPMRVAMSIMGDRFFVELRTKRSLTYAPQAAFNTSLVKNPHEVFYASSTKPKEALNVMIDQINEVKNQGFKEKELKDKKEEFLTNHYSRLETNGAQSLAIGANEIAGSWKGFETLMGAVDKLTVNDLNKVFNKYSNSINWMYLGKEKEVSKEDFKQPQILPDGGKVGIKK